MRSTPILQIGALTTRYFGLQKVIPSVAPPPPPLCRSVHRCLPQSAHKPKSFQWPCSAGAHRSGGSGHRARGPGGVRPPDRSSQRHSQRHPPPPVQAAGRRRHGPAHSVTGVPLGECGHQTGVWTSCSAGGRPRTCRKSTRSGHDVQTALQSGTTIAHLARQKGAAWQNVINALAAEETTEHPGHQHGERG